MVTRIYYLTPTIRYWDKEYKLKEFYKKAKKEVKTKINTNSASIMHFLDFLDRNSTDSRKNQVDAYFYESVFYTHYLGELGNKIAKSQKNVLRKMEKQNTKWGYFEAHLQYGKKNGLITKGRIKSNLSKDIKEFRGLVNCALYSKIYEYLQQNKVPQDNIAEWEIERALGGSHAYNFFTRNSELPGIKFKGNSDMKPPLTKKKERSVLSKIWKYITGKDYENRHEIIEGIIQLCGDNKIVDDNGGVMSYGSFINQLQKVVTDKVPFKSVDKALTELHKRGAIPPVKELHDGTRIVTLRPVGLNDDEIDVLDLASTQNRGVSQAEVMELLNWNSVRAETVLKNLEDAGIARATTSALEGKMYYFPGLVRLQLGL